MSTSYDPIASATCQSRDRTPQGKLVGIRQITLYESFLSTT